MHDMADKRTLEVMVAVMLLFLAMALIAYYDSSKGIKIFDMGLPGLLENIVVMIFSLFSVSIVVFEIVKIETRKA